MAIHVYRTSSVTAQFANPQEIIISHLDDSIKIGDGTNLAGVTADNELKVLPTTAEYTVRVDEASSTTTYIGNAVVGSSEASGVWQIQRLTVSGAITTLAFADGDEDFNNVWSNRLALSYS